MGQRGGSALRAFAVLLVAPVLAAVLGVAGTATPAAAAKQDRAEAVVAAALVYLGRPYRLGGEGPEVLDCSGLVFRAFSDAGQLTLVGGARMRAVGYLRWFERRGLATTDETLAERGDLIVYADGEHIGVYLGRGEVVSALTTSGITVHRLHGINWAFSHVLKVDWSKGKNPPVLPPADDDAGDDGEGETDSEGGSEGEGGIVGVTTGSLNLRAAADPAAEVVGVISRGTDFAVIGAGRSPSGSVWLNVSTSAGASGWIWSQFTELPEDADLDALADDEPESVGTATGALNLRSEPDPAAEIVGFVGLGSSFAILGGAHSPGGWLWLNVETEEGATGWIWSRWTEYPTEVVPELAATEAELVGEESDSAGDEAAEAEGEDEGEGDVQGDGEVQGDGDAGSDGDGEDDEGESVAPADGLQGREGQVDARDY